MIFSHIAKVAELGYCDSLELFAKEARELLSARTSRFKVPEQLLGIGSPGLGVSNAGG